MRPSAGSRSTLLEPVLAHRHTQVQRYRQALSDCLDLTWQAVPSDCIHGYKDLAVLFREPGQREPPRPPSRLQGVMTKRYFFPVHRMDVYREVPPAVRCRSPTGSMSDYFASRSTPICPMRASTPLHNSSAPAQFVRPRSRRRLESCDGPDPKMRLCGSTLRVFLR